uniref:THAP-type domain-containing protein n=1 Tax=Gouania willdenowi TaxID=441366 RepID=A0A8C5DQ81_GOUWI
MPGSHCCVKNCSNTSHDSHGRRRNNGIQFFSLPKWTQHLGEQVSDRTRRRRLAWLAAIRRKDLTFDLTPPWMSVCSLHFHSGIPSYEMLENHPDWTPSLLLGHNDVKNTDQARYQRQLRCRTQKLERPSPPTQDQLQAQALPQPPAQDQLQVPPPPDQDQEQTPPPPGQDMECGLCTSRRDVINNLLEENRELKRELDMYWMNENFLGGDDNTVKYYTGLPNFALFQTLLLTLTPYLPQGRMKKLSPFQLVLLTLMRLRLDLPIQHLSHLFRVHRTTVADAFHHTLGVMYAQLCPLVHWPSRECLLTSMPHQFVESFGNNVAAIVDCFEVFIEKPSNVLARAQTFSQYKHAYTMKYLIVITPQGVISFISNGWGGRASDKHITEQSGFLNKLLPGDIVLADRGFNIRKHVGMMCAEVKIPTFTRGHSQLEAKDVEETRPIAHLRIHVERVIGNLMPLDKIVTVCCALTNMCKSVV